LISSIAIGSGEEGVGDIGLYSAAKAEEEEEEEEVEAAAKGF
jgi:hypothetical protein